MFMETLTHEENFGACSPKAEGLIDEKQAFQNAKVQLLPPYNHVHDCVICDLSTILMLISRWLLLACVFVFFIIALSYLLENAPRASLRISVHQEGSTHSSLK